MKRRIARLMDWMVEVTCAAAQVMLILAFWAMVVVLVVALLFGVIRLVGFLA